MRAVRAVAFAALAFAAALAIFFTIGWFQFDNLEPDSFILLLAILAFNLACVPWLSRRGPQTRLAEAGLWLVISGVGIGFILILSGFWVDLLLPPVVGVETAMHRLLRALQILIVFSWIGIATLVVGWGLWLAAFLLGRRAAA
ncbi:hypothetical protein P1X14_07450 [Sphingomonas sp. AOB5]|uniref:hypothetical protein n=1 Tax=Sphingomonas sp. AOB5 TaxID=3034017 RepID=UPI0023F6BD61|nr:hypothetical protein [Sphingomonas sp. AOB5]MDF7775076.1 hypothetical protein [Sphingomonas sp. AOB5]